MFDLFNRHAAHVAVCLALLTLVARLVAAVARVHRATHPRLAAAIEALGAASPDPVRVGVQTYEALTGRRLAPAWVLLGDALRGAAAAPSSPPADDPGARVTVVPGDRPPGDEMTRAGRRGAPAGLLGATCLALAVGSLGCASGGGVEAAALKAGVTVLEGAGAVRRVLCSRALDPLLGDPRPAEVSADSPRSSGGQAPAPAPAPSSPPALPPPPAATPATEGDAGAPDDTAAPATDGG